MTVLYSLIKTATRQKWDFSTLDKGDDTRLATAVSGWLSLFFEKWFWGQWKLTASGTTSTCTRSSQVHLSPQYSTKSLRLRKITVQLVTIKVIPDRHHGVYHMQQSLNECGRIHWVDYSKVICCSNKYRGYKNYIFKVSPYNSTFKLKLK